MSPFSAGAGGAIGAGALGRVGPQINSSWLQLARRNGGLKASNLWRPGRLTGRMYGSTLWSAGIGFDLGAPGDWLYQQIECG